MKRGRVRALGALTLALTLAMPPVLTGCASASTQESVQVASLQDGTYEIEVTTDSSMFHAAHCTLEVAGDTLTAHLALPGEGFSRLFFGTAEEAGEASDDLIYDYYLGDDGLYTFDLPVSALDEELTIAAFGQRRDTWYDHTITFASPAGDQ